MIYLDTHAVIWLYAGNRKLFSKKAIELIENQTLVISPLVMLEIHYMNEIGRVNPKSKEIISHLTEVCGLSICRKKYEDVCFKAMTLDFTRDPFDRLITAQAALNENLILTKDKTIQQNYHGAVW